MIPPHRTARLSLFAALLSLAGVDLPVVERRDERRRKLDVPPEFRAADTREEFVNPVTHEMARAVASRVEPIPMPKPPRVAGAYTRGEFLPTITGEDIEVIIGGNRYDAKDVEAECFHPDIVEAERRRAAKAARRLERAQKAEAGKRKKA